MGPARRFTGRTYLPLDWGVARRQKCPVLFWTAGRCSELLGIKTGAAHRPASLRGRVLASGGGFRQGEDVFSVACCVLSSARFLHNNRITHLVPGTFNHLESMKRL